MKSNLRLLSLVIAATLGACAVRSSPADGVSANVEQAVLAAHEQRRVATLAADVSALDSMMTADLTFTHPNGVEESKAEFLWTLRTGALRYQSITDEERREGGRMLRDYAGTQHVLGNAEAVRIAHPHDLLMRSDWSHWQRECFQAERIQPFKQSFRELYPITTTERGTDRTRRYAGHQVNPRQALALLGGRGWVARPEEGVSRTYHDEGLTARLGFQEAFYTPADIEGLTLEDVVFTKKGEWTPLPLDSIPPRVFSEAMRDLDLVVSVAHQGGVDPESSASTVEMRATLLSETCNLLGLTNVEVSGSHAMIRGTLGEYAVHLGSAGAMVLPGTALPIVAVHSQHRGRIFLPFADDDPRTAEVLSKVLLLARDGEIRDPNILEWIRAARGMVSS